MLLDNHFSLWFIDDDVRCMMKDPNTLDWVTLHTLSLGAPNFQTEMIRFCEYVCKESDNDPLITVFLPSSDILCGSVTVVGRTQDARDQHVRRTLARQLGDHAENIVADFGKTNNAKIAPVCFALRSTLYTAERFLSAFGFKVRCYSTMSENGLSEEPCLMLPHQLERFQQMNSMPKASYAFRGAAAAMFAASLIIAADIPEPNSAMMANILDAGNVPGQPVHVALHIGNLDNPIVTDGAEMLNGLVTFAQNTQAAQSIDILMTAPTRTETLPIIVSVLGADRVVPTEGAAKYLDAVTAHKGGFHIYVGQQGNLTQLATDDEVTVGAGQIVYIQKPVTQTFQVARAIQQQQIWRSVPDQFKLTELEIASFSRP